MNKVPKNQIIRQGDVMLVPLNEEPNWQNPPRKNPANRIMDGKVILAFGEVTGHAHAITGAATLEVGTTPGGWFPSNNFAGGGRWVAPGAVEVLRVGSKPVTLTHEEHAGFTLPAKSAYQVVIQREYSPEAMRRVID